jgi:hypothetical protein
MVWLGGPRGKTGRRNPIVLHDPPPGYRPRAGTGQREARQDWLLMRVTTVVLVLAAAAFVVLMMIFIVTRI